MNTELTWPRVSTQQHRVPLFLQLTNSRLQTIAAGLSAPYEHMSTLPTLSFSICRTHHLSPTTKNHWHTYYFKTRMLCARQSFVVIHKRDSSSTTTIKTTTAASCQHHSTAEGQQQRQQQRGWWPNVAGDNARAWCQQYRQTAKQDLPIHHETNFQKSEAVMNSPHFWLEFFLEPQNHENNRQK